MLDEVKKMKAKVIFDKLVVFTTPGGVHYVTWMDKGDICFITEGYEYSERPWKDKRFCKVVTPTGEVGFCAIAGLTPIKENSK